jgi:transposase-like protein
MGQIRRSHSSAFKAKVAFEAMKKEKTLAQLSSEYGVHPNMINQWKRRMIQELPEIFSRKKDKQKQDTEELVSELYRQIGQLKVELDWVKKKSGQLNC